MIAMDEKPTEAVRAKPNSSLVVACRPSAKARRTPSSPPATPAPCSPPACSSSAGSPSVRRPAIAVTIPARRGPSVLLDAGANADARPEDLVQFAHMGAVFAQEILGVREPRGTPALDRRGGGEGEPLRARGARAARRCTDLNFAGNTEGRDLLLGAADVVVTDGFTGNVTLKLLEGTITSLLDAFREEITATSRGKLGGLLIRPAARRLRDRLDPDTYGGAYLLGLRGLAVIAHGNSSRRAIENAVRLAARGVEHDVVGRLAQRLSSTVLEVRPLYDPDPQREVKWQRRARKSTSE